jgi:hypothetical protein
MRVRKRYLCTLISLSLSQVAWGDRPEESMTVWSSSVPAATTNILGTDTIQSLDKQDVAHALSVMPGVVLQKSGGRNEPRSKFAGLTVAVSRYFSTACQSMSPTTVISTSGVFSHRTSGQWKCRRVTPRCCRGQTRWAAPYYHAAPEQTAGGQYRLSPGLEP